MLLASTKNKRKVKEKIMFRSLNENELMMVNGGFYYVPCYILQLVWTGSYYKRNLIFLHTTQVASGSGIKSYIDGVPQYY